MSLGQHGNHMINVCNEKSMFMLTVLFGIATEAEHVERLNP